MGVALITGSSAGLGAEFAKLFADDGHSVILVARRRDRIHEVARALKGIHPQIQAFPIEQDLGHPGAGAELFEKVVSLNLPRIDFLVNNAAFGTSGPFAQLPITKELELIDLNVRSLVELTRLFLPQMLSHGQGKILNVGSVAGFQPGPFMASYYASKAYVNHFSEALQEELRGTGVSCTLLAPGPTNTEFAQVAGLEKSLLFNLGNASAVQVAKAGYEGLLTGKTLVIPGWRNRILVQAVKWSPRWLTRKIAAMLNQHR